jgi:DNA repair protein RadC
VREVIDRENGELNIGVLAAVNGIGGAKAAKIVAALEFARRRIRPEGVRIREPKDVLPLLTHFSDRKQEHFICVSLNAAHEVIASRVVSIGLVSSAQVHPREVFAEPLQDRASAVIVAHNHPSGDLTPSEADKKITKQISDAGKILGIKVLDHVIFGRRGYFSFQEAGWL